MVAAVAHAEMTAVIPDIALEGAMEADAAQHFPHKSPLLRYQIRRRYDWSIAPGYGPCETIVRSRHSPGSLAQDCGAERHMLDQQRRVEHIGLSLPNLQATLVKATAAGRETPDQRMGRHGDDYCPTRYRRRPRSDPRTGTEPCSPARCQRTDQSRPKRIAQIQLSSANPHSPTHVSSNINRCRKRGLALLCRHFHRSEFSIKNASAQ